MDGGLRSSLGETDLRNFIPALAAEHLADFNSPDEQKLRQLAPGEISE